ncbi:hypothetical protein C2S51_033914 [Perilla frutescens var. frutescens]|nr:hypothetical protein C2S51_033914 [Perilla frutescens var. frutescens]
MIAFVRKNVSCLILNPNSNHVRKSSVYFSLYFQNISTWIESEACINHKFSNILVREHNFAPEFASRVASKLSRVKNPENAGLILSFLKGSGFSDSRFEKLLRHEPRFLSASLEDNIKPKIKFFQEIGISSNDIWKIISDNPGILDLSLTDNIIPSLSLLKRLLGSDDEAARVVCLAPRILPSNLENTLLPNVEFFKSCGLPMERIRILLTNFPLCLLMKPEAVRKSVEKANEMGLHASSKTFIYAVPTIAAMSNEAWELKLHAFRSLGFSDTDVLTMFRNAPTVFAVSAEKIKKIKELLLDTGKYTVSSIVKYPKSLQSSIEKRYMPRLKILATLESRSLIKDWPSLAEVSVLRDDQFYKRFVFPYSDKISNVCTIKSSA